MSDSELVVDDEESNESHVYGEEMAYEPDEPEAVEPGDVYGSSDSHWFEEFEDHEPVKPDGLYEEIATHWPENVDDTEPAHRYGDSDPIPEDTD